MDDKTTKILEIKIDEEEAIKSITQLTTALTAVKERETQLTKELKENAKEQKLTQEEVRKKRDEINALKEAEKDYKTQLNEVSRAVQNQLKADRFKEGSLKQLRAELSNMTKQYDEMSKAERDSARGMELQKKIKETTIEIKNVEEATERYQRNVGNYKNALIETGAAFQQAGVSSKGLNLSLKALNANPIILFLTALVAAVKTLIEAFKGNEQAMMGLKEAFSAFNPIIDIVRQGLDALAKVVVNVVTKAVNGLTSAIGWLLDKAQQVGSFFGADWHMGDNFKAGVAAAKDLQQAENEYIKHKREWSVEEAKIDRDVADLREKSVDKEKYTAKQRQEFLDQAIDLETKKYQSRKQLAEENLRLIQREAARSENSAEMNDKLAEAERAVIQADKELADTKRNLNRQRQRTTTELNSETKASTEYAKTVVAETRKAEDALLELVKDTQQKRLIQENLTYERKKEDLEKSMQEEAKAHGTSTALYEQYAIQMETLEKQHQTNLDNLARTFDDEELKKTASIYQQKINLAQKNSAEQFELRKQLLETQMQQELANTELTEEQKQLIREKYEKSQSQLRDEQTKATAEQVTKEWEARIMQAEIAGEDYGQLELDMLKERLDNLQQYELESQDEFLARKLAAEKAYLDQKKKLADKEVQIETAKMSAIGKIMGNLSDLLEEAGEENEAMVRFSKVLALAEIAINTGVAIAKGIKASQDVPFPANLAAVATTIAEIIAGITSAITTVKSAKFATGGKVKGAGTKTSDSIPARLSDGEVVVKADSAEEYPTLLHEINTATGGDGIPHPSTLTEEERRFIESHSTESDSHTEESSSEAHETSSKTSRRNSSSAFSNGGRATLTEEERRFIESSKEKETENSFSKGGNVSVSTKEVRFNNGGQVLFPALAQSVSDLGSGISVPVQNQTTYSHTTIANAAGGITPEQIAEAMRQLPPSEVAVSEIKRVNDRVNVIENLRTY